MGRAFLSAHPRVSDMPAWRDGAAERSNWGGSPLSIESDFKSPPNEYRSVPFWSWNDDLDPEELRRQVRTMKEAGIGGGFMHARVGLITPYVGDKWMECIRATVDESKKVGFGAWLYDEDKWPSGDHSGQVRKGNREFEAKRIELVEAEITETGLDFEAQEHALATFVCKKRPRSGRITDVRRVEEDGIDPSQLVGYSVLHFHVGYHGYADLLSKPAMRRFIDLAYEPYAREVGDEFGKTVPGDFTDEPQWRCPPWTGELPERFLRDKGYDLLGKLPALFYETPDYRQVRYDYWDMVTNLFREAFTEPIYAWCEEHGLAWTGHFMAEDDLIAQIGSIGQGMEHYEYMQIPGIDHLTRRIADPVRVKQCSSVCHQFGGRRMLSEMYGCSGWNMSFEDHRWIGEWQCVLGVDLVCQHLQLYSLKGCRKRDYPPSYQQQPWYEHYRLVSDYLARVCFAMQQGRHVADILVLHPQGSAWQEFSPLDRSAAREYSNDFARLSQLLCEMKRDYDYGDEKIMARHAKAAGGKLHVGTGAYSVVILPPMNQIRETTLRLLGEFLDAGGTVLALSSPPGYIEGQKSDLPKQLLAKRMERVRLDAKSLEKALGDTVDRDVAVSADRQDVAPIFYQHRDLGSRQLYYFVNTSNEQGFERVALRMRGEGGLELWDLTTGQVRDIPGVREGPFAVAHVDFAPAGAWLFAVNSEKELFRGALPRTKEIRSKALGKRWSIVRCDPNALTLDYCQYRIEDEPWSDLMPHWQAQREVNRLEKPVALTFRYTFQSNIRPTDLSHLWLVAERPAESTILFNGEEVRHTDEGWWCDTAFRKIAARELLKRGRNVVDIEVAFDGGYEVEAIYVLGDFDVASKRNREFALVKRGSHVQTGDLVGQGLPFFRGRIALEQVIELTEVGSRRAFLELPQMAAIVADVKVNTQPCGQIAWRPHRIEITNALREGENVVHVELYSSCRNLLGPHHHKAGELIAVGPNSFSDSVGWLGAKPGESTWVDRYNFVPFGLPRAARIFWIEES